IAGSTTAPDTGIGEPEKLDRMQSPPAEAWLAAQLRLYTQPSFAGFPKMRISVLPVAGLFTSGPTLAVRPNHCSRNHENEAGELNARLNVKRKFCVGVAL